MAWRDLLLAIVLVASAASGCVGDAAPRAPASLYEKVELLGVVGPEEVERLNLSDARETGLLQASLDALVGIHEVHRRTFQEGQIPGAFDESRYVYLKFREPTSVELPRLQGGETRAIEEGYLVLNGTQLSGNVVLDGPTRGEFTSDYDEAELARLADETIERDGPQGTYTFVWVQGSERTHPPPEQRETCTYLWDHRVNTTTERIEYRAEGYDFDPADVTKLVAFDHFDETRQCPEAMHLDASPDTLTTGMGAYGNLTLAHAANGTVQVGDRGWVGAGENLTVTYREPVDDEQADRDRWVNGSFTVHNFGEWPRRGLEAG